MNKRQLLAKALESHYVAKLNEALATLEVYSDSAVGIGEHPQIVEEMVKLVDQAGAAEGGLSVVKRYLCQECNEQQLPTPNVAPTNVNYDLGAPGSSVPSSD